MQRADTFSMNPLVTVVIPTFNRLHFLKAAIDSVFGQTYERWNLVVVDDGSTDGTREYVCGIHDSRVRLLALAHEGIVARSRNAGARVATGDYLAFLDSDDVWMADKLAIQLERMKKAEVRWSYTRYDYMDEHGRSVPGKAGAWRALSGLIAQDVIAAEAPIAIITVVVERELFQALGGFDEDPAINFREDYDLVVRLALHAETLAIPECLARLREHTGRATKGLHAAQPFLATARVYDKLLGHLDDHELRRVAKHRRAYHLAEAGAHLLREGSLVRAAGLFMRSLLDRPASRQWASALTRGLGLDALRAPRSLR